MQIQANPEIGWLSVHQQLSTYFGVCLYPRHIYHGQLVVLLK